MKHAPLKMIFKTTRRGKRYKKLFISMSQNLSEGLKTISLENKQKQTNKNLEKKYLACEKKPVRLFLPGSVKDK